MEFVNKFVADGVKVAMENLNFLVDLVFLGVVAPAITVAVINIFRGCQFPSRKINRK